MFNLGMPELVVIFIVALLVFGPKRLPELGKTLGRAINEFKRSSQEFKDHLETEVGTSEIKDELLKQQKELRDSLKTAEKPAEESKPEPSGEETKKEEPTSHAG